MVSGDRLPNWLVVALLLAGCIGVIPAADVGEPPFPECSQEAYAFVGDSSLAALGLAEMWPEEASRVGEIWITAAPPPPGVWGMPPGAPPITERLICVEFDDGSGMAGPVADDWQPPGGFGLPPIPEGSPVAVLGVVVAVAVVAGASLLAFGIRPRTG